MKTVKDLSITELKSEIYDRLVAIKKFQIEIETLNSEIVARSKPGTQEPKEKKKK